MRVQKRIPHEIKTRTDSPDHPLHESALQQTLCFQSEASSEPLYCRLPQEILPAHRYQHPEQLFEEPSRNQGDKEESFVAVGLHNCVF